MSAPLASADFGANLDGALQTDWRLLSAKLPAGRDAASTESRQRLFNRMDANANGYLSLAEVDKGVRDAIGSTALFSAKPVMQRAFRAAKGASKSADLRGPHYVGRTEFRLLLVYLRQYFELYAMFNRVDASDDRRIDLPVSSRPGRVRGGRLAGHSSRRSVRRGVALCLRGWAHFGALARLQEFERALPQLESWGLALGSAEEEFAQIDR